MKPVETLREKTMNIRTLMTTSLVTLLLVGGAHAKEGDHFLNSRTAEQVVTSIPAANMVATTASENNSNRWIHRDSDRD